MNTKDDSKPIGWVLPAPENSEGKALAEAWVVQHKPLLDMLTTTIAADLEAKNGDSLMMMWVTLKGIADELHGILTHKPVEVVSDEVVH